MFPYAFCLFPCAFCFKVSTPKSMHDGASGFSTNVCQCLTCLYVSPVSFPLFWLPFCRRGRSFPVAHKDTIVLAQGRTSGPFSLLRLFAGCVMSCLAAGAMHTDLCSHVVFVYSYSKLWEGCHATLVVISIQTAYCASCNLPACEWWRCWLRRSLPSNLV